MVKKEIRDSLPRAIIVLSLYLLVPLFHLLNALFFHTDTNLIVSLTTATLLAMLVAIIASVNMFKSEYTDHALEYLLSLPISRGKIFFAKILPDIALKYLLLLIYVLLYSSRDTILFWEKTFFTHPLFFLLLLPIYSLFSFIGRLLRFQEMTGKEAFAFVGLLFISLIVGVICIKDLALSISDFEKGLITGLTPVLLVYTVITIAFFKNYARIDLKPVKVHRKRIFRLSFLIMTPMWLVALISTLLT